MPPKHRATKQKKGEESPKAVKSAEKEEVHQIIPTVPPKSTSSEPIPSESNDQKMSDAADEPESQVITESAETLKPAPSSGMAERMRKLAELKKRKEVEVAEGNRQDRNEEFQRSKANPREEIRLERKRREAEELLARKEAEERGEDYERIRYWGYSAEEVERWEEKQAAKADRAATAFTNHNQMAHKKYQSLVSEIKPDMVSYNDKKAEAIAHALMNGEEFDESAFFGDANSLTYAGGTGEGAGGVNDKPSREALDRLVADVQKQIEKRQSRSRKRDRDPEDITWINDSNRRFNEKIARFYDKYTREIRENFERGTAL